jgi:hypothetical protein
VHGCTQPRTEGDPASLVVVRAHSADGTCVSNSTIRRAWCQAASPGLARRQHFHRVLGDGDAERRSALRIGFNTLEHFTLRDP